MNTQVHSHPRPKSDNPFQEIWEDMGITDSQINELVEEVETILEDFDLTDFNPFFGVDTDDVVPKITQPLCDFMRKLTPATEPAFYQALNDPMKVRNLNLIFGCVRDHDTWVDPAITEKAEKWMDAMGSETGVELNEETIPYFIDVYHKAHELAEEKRGDMVPVEHEDLVKCFEDAFHIVDAERALEELRSFDWYEGTAWWGGEDATECRAFFDKIAGPDTFPHFLELMEPREAFHVGRYLESLAHLEAA